MAAKNRNEAALTELLSLATPEAISNLILQLAAGSPEVRRECFEFLKSNTKITKKMKTRSEGEIILALWDELDSDLWELNDYGGGDFSAQQYVSDLLYRIKTLLESKKIGQEYRDKILDLVVPYIRDGNAGLDDELDEVARATCYSDSDYRTLARACEAMQDEWKTACARRLYRQIGDRSKYLELRRKRMKYGSDFHDLATFYWESGEKEEALRVAEEGLRKGQGRMDELRSFVARRAKQSGNREKYVLLEFAQASDCLTYEKYMAFKKLCRKKEWELYEPKLIEILEKTRGSRAIKIRMHRQEFAEVLAILAESKYPVSEWGGADDIKAAAKLEKRYPEDILRFYLSGLGDLKNKATRKEYVRQAGVMAKVRHMMVDVLEDKPQWRNYAKKVKLGSIKRPAFQQEFARVLPDWRDLK